MAILVLLGIVPARLPDSQGRYCRFTRPECYRQFNRHYPDRVMPLVSTVIRASVRSWAMKTDCQRANRFEDRAGGPNASGSEESFRWKGCRAAGASRFHFTGETAP